MLDASPLMAFVATTRPDRTRAFYEGTLGLRLLADDPFALVYDAHGTMLRIQKVQDAVVPPYTTLGWQVTDARAAVRALRAKGVSFERYPGLAHDDLGIWTSPSGSQVAWFKDPDGHTLSLTQF